MTRRIPEEKSGMFQVIVLNKNFEINEWLTEYSSVISTMQIPYFFTFALLIVAASFLFSACQAFGCPYCTFSTNVALFVFRLTTNHTSLMTTNYGMKASFFLSSLLQAHLNISAYLTFCYWRTTNFHS